MSYDPIIITSEDSKHWKHLRNSLVSLKTLKQELGKEKRSAKKDGIKESYQISHHLEYVSPVMELIEIRKFEIKESQFDPKTGDRKKDFPQFIAKCKWYNPKGSKFSERFLPVETLNLIPEIDTKIFDLISNIIEEEIFIYIEKKIGEIARRFLFKPSLLYKSGYYYLSGYNILNNKDESVYLDDDINPILVKNPFTETWPKFDPDRKLITKENFINANIEVENFWRIKYENYHSEVTSRTITPKAIGTDKISIDSETSTIKYLTAHCHLRNAERHFRFDRIRSIQVIEIPKIPI